jgi:hypothetical protein
MNRSPDVELVLRDYFADDSASAPDHLLDEIEERIMRQPQQRARWISWRDSHVNSYLKPLFALAAVVVVAVAGFAILRPSGAGVGGPPTPVPTATPTMSPSPTSSAPTPTPSQTGSFGGTVHFRGDGAAMGSTEVDAVASGANVTGTAVIRLREGIHTVRLGCVARDGQTWALAGTVEESTIRGEPIGAWSRIVVKDGSPQQISIWLSGDAPAGVDCAGFLATFPFADLGPENWAPVESGELVPPADLAP